jgi:ribosome maturation factor RimP
MAQPGSRAQQLAALQQLIQPAVQAAGLDLEDLQLSQVGRRRQLRISVDGDGGVLLDQIADISKRIAAILDEADPLGEEPYLLEVSSRGVAQPLKLPRHWRRSIGRLVEVTRDSEISTGRIESVTELSAALAGPAGPFTVSFADQLTAIVQVEFTRPAAGEDDGLLELEDPEDLAGEN